MSQTLFAIRGSRSPAPVREVFTLLHLQSQCLISAFLQVSIAVQDVSCERFRSLFPNLNCLRVCFQTGLPVNQREGVCECVCVCMYVSMWVRAWVFQCSCIHMCRYLCACICVYFCGCVGVNKCVCMIFFEQHPRSVGSCMHCMFVVGIHPYQLNLSYSHPLKTCCGRIPILCGEYPHCLGESAGGRGVEWRFQSISASQKRTHHSDLLSQVLDGASYPVFVTHLARVQLGTRKIDGSDFLWGRRGRFE